MYNLNWLISQYNDGVKLKYLYFWGHTPNRDGSIGKSCFSQWWEQAFEVNGNVYPTAEHWMMFKKAELFGDAIMQSKILQSKTPGEAKALGRKVQNFDQATWEANRTNIVVEGNQHKFEQHEELKVFLMNTKDRILVEASPVDNIWGIGLAQDATGIEDPNAWKGLNLLGFALMEVRENLR